MTNRLLHALFAAPDAWCYEEISDRSGMVPDYAASVAAPMAVAVGA